MRLWPRTRLQALFAAEANGQALSEALARELRLDSGRIEAELLADRAWEREWLRDFHARRFGRRLWVCPHHEQVSASGAIVVRLDPGLAFGTGTHASTALCLDWLDAHLRSGHRVIDYGSGSGILGIAAALLGAGPVYPFYIHPPAVTAVAVNSSAQRVRGRRSYPRDARQPPAQALLLVAP